MLDDGTGRTVGYIIGCADTSCFAQRWRSCLAPTVDPAVVPPPGAHLSEAQMQAGMARQDISHFRTAVYEARCSMLLAWPEVLERYPAHLHIDILEGWQRKGWGTVLMQAFLEEVRRMGARGVHLDMVEANEGARRFYEGLGFAGCEEVLDGGVSGRKGVNGIVVTLVKEL